MFSQFRQAVESFAPQPRRSTDGEEIREPVSRSNSLDSSARPSSPLSSSQLAESALVNLRKSLATQRVSSQSPANKGAASPPIRSKTTLEDRLRAATASSPSTPDVSKKGSPTPVEPIATHSLSPSSTPLPSSPPLSPTAEDAAPPVLPVLPVEVVAVTSQGPGRTSSPTIEERQGSSPAQISAEITNETEQEDTVHNVSSPPDTIPVEVATIETLQERLKEFEQRFTDVSTSFKRLQAEKIAADSILRELTPLDGVQDSTAFRDYLETVTSKTKHFQDEIQHLTDKLQRQESRSQELRDTHRLESTSQSELVKTLRTQLKEAEALLQVAHSADTQAEETAIKRKADIEQFQIDLERVKLLAKEEEEKRVKAISLLKTVRQKLVKAEKEKDDVTKELGLLKEREKDEKDKVQAEKASLKTEIDLVNSEREKAVTGLRAQFDKEIGSLKDRYEKDIRIQQEKAEADITVAKKAHLSEISSKNSHIASLELSLRGATNEKNSLFDQLELRQAELESAQSHLESIQSENMELQYQLRESNDRYASLKEDLAETRRDQENKSREPLASNDEVARLLSATEARYEAKLSDLKKHIATVEKERNDGEAEWSRKLRDKVREMDELKRVIGSAARTRENDEEMMARLRADVLRLEAESHSLQRQLSELHLSSSRVKEIETLREELRKVQSSAALLERQRNPGVGYWTSRVTDNPADSRTSISSAPSESPSRVSSPVPSTLPLKNEEEVNLEYLRNVILQFLEHKEMRPNLVKVLSIILHFTPQETRRLIAKV